MAKPQTLLESEANVQKLFGKIRVNRKGFLDLLTQKVDNRSEIIFNQVAPYLKNLSGKVIDWGTGDGQVAQMLHEKLGLDITGVDVRDFKAGHVTIPIILFDGHHLDVRKAHYDGALLTNVLHHEKDNEKIIKELTRTVRNVLVILETVPTGDTDAEQRRDFERTFLNDVLWNRYFKNADIPVPGTYETSKDWIARFEKWGWKLSVMKDFGYDQPTVRDVHHLFVFKREA